MPDQAALARLWLREAERQKLASEMRVRAAAMLDRAQAMRDRAKAVAERQHGTTERLERRVTDDKQVGTALERAEATIEQVAIDYEVSETSRASSDKEGQLP